LLKAWYCGDYGFWDRADMSDTDRWANIYLNFRDSQQWLAELLASMTHAEYMSFVEYCFGELDLAAEAKDGAEFRRVKGLIMALARKQLEVARFMDGLTDRQKGSRHGSGHVLL
jgi:hypothetical protein